MRVLFAFILLACPSFGLADTCKDLTDQFGTIVDQQTLIADEIRELVRTPTMENEARICRLIDTLIPLREKQDMIIKSVVQGKCASTREVGEMRDVLTLASGMYCAGGRIRHKDDPSFVFVPRK